MFTEQEQHFKVIGETIYYDKGIGPRCPECGQQAAYAPLGSRLPTCYNSGGHESGEPIAFIDWGDEDESEN